VELQKGHTLIDTGPYASVRHPIITSFFLIAFGIFFVNPSIPTGFALAYTFWDFTRAAEQEEKLLSTSVDGYDAYINRTSRFLPNPWKKK
jgi:protein-S-isoprenylcysteine O-methyltransferase Ste14